MNWFLLTTVVLYVGASLYEVLLHRAVTRDAALYASFGITNAILTLWG